MSGIGCIVSIVSLLVAACAQLTPNNPFGDGSPYQKDVDEKINQILTRTIALEEEYGKLKSTVDEIGKRVDTLYHGSAEWGQWSSFSTCSQTCTPANGSAGVQTRTRTCGFTVSPIIRSEAVCEYGESIQTRNCSADIPCLATVAPANPNDAVGGSGGNSFTDASVWNGQKITALRLNCNKLVNSIQVKYGNTWGNMHGRDFSKWDCDDGTDYAYTLDSTEYITSVQFRAGGLVDSMTITTNKRTLPKCGGSGGTVKTINGTRLLYVSGRSGCVIDKMQLHWAVQ